jgi:hypothetical protein
MTAPFASVGVLTVFAFIVNAFAGLHFPSFDHFQIIKIITDRLSLRSIKGKIFKAKMTLKQYRQPGPAVR